MQNPLSFMPIRSNKPRVTGVTMVMDKGLSLQEAENLISVAGHLIDYIKLGFGTSLVSNHVPEKIQLYQQHNIHVYLGGTLFEAFYIRNQLNDYKNLISEWKLNCIEISDGSMKIDHKTKCELIRSFANNYIVLSEVGYKDGNVTLNDDQWIELMQNELKAGSHHIIAEARESGNVGIYGVDGKANSALIGKLAQQISPDKILWEAPLKSQQVWFIKQFGSDVNLGNIASTEVIALETLRLGLRGDTFFDFLPEKFQSLKLS